jgi:hypothetical protein
MVTKEEILEQIRRTAKDNGGRPLGLDRFEKETGIKPYDWEKYWSRFGAAQQEAGFAPNQLQGAYSDEFMIDKIIQLTRKLKKFPTYREINTDKNNDPALSDKKSFGRLGTKEQLAKKVIEYCKTKIGYEDIVELSGMVLSKANEDNSGDRENDLGIGEVYLFKSGRYYKIGKTNDTVRRGSELRIQLPEKMDLIHSIKTDDTSGIEAYWHKRFESKRMNGEWFDLSAADVKAFKRWRRI